MTQASRKPYEESYSIESLIEKFNSISNTWHNETRPGNDGSPGNTLEDLLGVPENNLSLPDFGEVELKTQRMESGNLVTLFHKDPYPRPFGNLLKAMGWKHQHAGTKYPVDELSFRVTIPAGKFMARGFTIQLIEEQIHIIFDPSKVDTTTHDRTNSYPTLGDWISDLNSRKPHYSEVFPVFWDAQEFMEQTKKKLDNTLFALCKTRKQNNSKQFNYSEAYLFQGLNMNNLSNLFTEGGISIDFDTRTGHNHGTKLRIQRNRIPELFDNSIQLL